MDQKANLMHLASRKPEVSVPSRRSEAGFAPGYLIELMMIGVILGLLLQLFFGPPLLRIAAGALLVLGIAAAWILPWWMRYRPGDHVFFNMGPHRGRRGVVVVPINNGNGARVMLEKEGENGAVEVDIQWSYHMRKIRPGETVVLPRLREDL